MMSRIFNKLSIKSRLILMLLFVTLLSSIVIGFLGWRNGRVALNQTIFNQLTSTRAAQALQIESYFDTVFSQTRTLAEDRMIVNAMRQFREGYEVGIYRTLTGEQNDAVTDYYDDVFIPNLSTAFEDMPLAITYRPRRNVASYFQYHYMVDNPFPPGQKDEQATSEQDTTIYNRFHEFYHPIFRNLQREFNYYDIFLIDIETGNVVYTVFKETEFATSLREGPYRESGLGVLTDRIRDEPEHGAVTIVDFRAYAPSYDAPAAFVGAPIFDGTEAIGIFAVQISVDELDRVMTGAQGWEANGLGATGESYLVGSDRLMRSTSRMFLQDEAAYLSALSDYGVSDLTSTKINSFGTTILMQPVATDSVKNALLDMEGTHVTTNYLGQQVLSSYAPLSIEGLDWLIVSEMAQDEAFTPIFDLQRNILIWSVVLVLGVAFLAIMLSRFFVRPIEKLTAGVQALSDGDNSVHIDIEADDEFGDLARNFNAMVVNIREQSAIIERKNAENERLLLNILPAPIAERLQAGERIADRLQQVSIIFMHVVGFSELSQRMGAEESAEKLDELINNFDDVAERFAVERVKTIGDTYVAACGLTSPRLDHAKRAVDFAIAALRTVRRFDGDTDDALQIQIGIDSGPVISGVVGARQFNFELWGETVDMASRIHTEAEPGSILVTENVFGRVNAHFDLVSAKPVQYQTQMVQLYTVAIEDSGVFVVPAEAKA